MPELPEVETVRKQLEKVLVGQRIIKVECLREKSLQGVSLKVVLKVEGRKIVSVNRKAKMLVIGLHSQGKVCKKFSRFEGIHPQEIDKNHKTLKEDNIYILIHLKMTGQLIYVSGEKRVGGGHPTADWVSKLPSKHTRVVFELSSGKLYFNDMRVFGWVKIVDEKGKEDELRKYGPDVNSRQFNFNYLKKVLKSSKRAVKSVILDQKKIGGIGNIYANDGLYLAMINPKKPADQVSEGEAERLCKALKKVIAKSIKLGGASESDFVHTDGMGGSYQKHFLIYKKDGEKCRWCKKGIIRKEKIGGRGSYYCPKCQK